uniref:Pyrin domain-containing protein n=1 Tax=Seriola lalandi dorsalis TaxID=1841481 RepID=A0A3B4YDC0_SERLL
SQKTASDHPKQMILNTLDELTDEEFDKFRWYLQQQPDILASVAIPKSHLEKANRWETVDKIVEKHDQQSVKVVKNILKKINRNDLVEKLVHTVHWRLSGQDSFDYKVRT